MLVIPFSVCWTASSPASTLVFGIWTALLWPALPIKTTWAAKGYCYSGLASAAWLGYKLGEKRVRCRQCGVFGTRDFCCRRQPSVQSCGGHLTPPPAIQLQAAPGLLGSGELLPPFSSEAAGLLRPFTDALRSGHSGT
jgi:hypothetical protein